MLLLSPFVMQKTWPAEILVPGAVDEGTGEDFRVKGSGYRRGWLALQKVDRRWALVPTSITIRNQEKRVGLLPQYVLASSIPNAMYVFKGLALSAGLVHAMPDQKFEALQRTMGDDPSFRWQEEPQSLSFDYGNSTYRIFTSIDKNDSSWSVNLSNGPVTQSIVAEPGRSNNLALLWIGDLDRDGQVDLITKEVVEPPVCIQLWQSVGAPMGKLVRLAAQNCATD